MQCMSLRRDPQSDRAVGRANRIRVRPAQMAEPDDALRPADTGRQAALPQGGPGLAKMVGARCDTVLSEGPDSCGRAGRRSCLRKLAGLASSSYLNVLF